MPKEIESNGGTLRPFQPGQSGNPGGMSKALRAQIDANAAEAVRIRSALLAKIAAHIDPETGVFTAELGSDVLRLVKDSEDRGLGSPTTTVAGDPENPVGVRVIEHRIVDPVPRGGSGDRDP
jgi:hypothetical protein